MKKKHAVKINLSLKHAFAASHGHGQMNGQKISYPRSVFILKIALIHNNPIWRGEGGHPGFQLLSDDGQLEIKFNLGGGGEKKNTKNKINIIEINFNKTVNTAMTFMEDTKMSI